MPFFSIIIPVYNVAPYLRECLDSVVAQTFTDWEAICVDDGSTDGSGAILDEYAAKDSRFKVIHQSNTGVSAARNAALDVAKGEWICFLDADDLWHERFLEVFLAGMREYPNDVCFRSGFCCFDDETQKPMFAVGQCKFERIDISEAIAMRDFFDYYFFCYAYRRELFEGIRFPHYIRGEDRCVLNKLQLQRIDAIVATEDALYGYRQRQGSAMNSVPSAQVLRDEMDHRLDIMGMIDASGKKVDYAGNQWLEKYFTRSMYGIIESRTVDRGEVLSDWRNRLVRFRRGKGISTYGRFVARTSSLIHFRPWDALVCYVIPRFCEGGSPLRWIKRKFFSCRQGQLREQAEKL